MKTCKKCGFTKIYTGFYKKTSTKDGRTSQCKECINDRDRKQRKQLSEKHQKWSRENRVSINEYRKDWYKKNRESVLELQQKYRHETPERYLWIAAKKRAKAGDIPFDIEITDINIPETCPYLGLPLVASKGKPNDGSPSLDRIVPELGYVKGNIEVISYRANVIKSNANFEELMRIANRLHEISRN